MQIVKDDVVQPFDDRPRPNYKAYCSYSLVEFMIEFEEIEDFIVEIRDRLIDA